MQIDRARKASGLQVRSRTFVTAPWAGLQVDSTPRTYNRIPMVDFKERQNF